MREQLKAMLENQWEFNARVVDDWVQQDLEWYRAIWTESAELMDSLDWKWWKAQQVDMAQVKLEIVDIWCFCLSQLMQDAGAINDKLLDQMEAGLHRPAYSAESTELPEAVEAFAGLVLGTHAVPLSLFAAMLEGAGMSIDELYLLYVGKMALNRFRQDHGYRDGTYQKCWGELTDNECLVVVADACTVGDLDMALLERKIYAQLESNYRMYVLARTEPKMPRLRTERSSFQRPAGDVYLSSHSAGCEAVAEETCGL